MPVTKRTQKKPGRSSAAKRTTTTTSKASVKRDEEREHYHQRVTENEARLDSGLNAHEEPLTPVQIETLRRVIEAQRVKLAELMANSEGSL